jgi:hypothetical protein
MHAIDHPDIIKKVDKNIRRLKASYKTKDQIGNMVLSYRRLMEYH